MKKNNFSFGIALVLILVAITSRFLPHPPNFTAVGAVALFGGAFFSNNRFTWLIPFVALLISDVILNTFVYHIDFSWYSLGTYLAFGIIYLLGNSIKKISVTNVLLGSFLASFLFFVVTNTFSWITFDFYTKDLTGLLSSYAAGLPFFWNTVVGDLFYVTVLFGSYIFLTKKVFKTQSL